jgi:nicotinate (nicotinamide) nucleotide adenylyltransferase
MTIKEFVLIPVFQPNLIANKKSPKAHFNHRVDMCKIIATKLSGQLEYKIIVSEIEQQIAINTGQNNFSLNTIKHLNKKNSLFMVSADHFKGRWPKFRKWFGWKEILKHSGLLINQRPGHKINKNFIKQLREINPDVYLVESHTSVNTSSSQIRDTFYTSNMESHLSKEVIDFINIQNLY